MIRPAAPADVPVVLELVHELAAYEKEPDAVEATETDFTAALFPESGTPTTRCLIAELDGTVIGMAVWYVTFSTWTGRNGIWLEDLFVDPHQRGHGIGKALLARLAATCIERGWTRLEWAVLDWNTPSIEFYRAHGARTLVDWTTFRLDGDGLARLASA